MAPLASSGAFSGSRWFGGYKKKQPEGIPGPSGCVLRKISIRLKLEVIRRS